MPKLAATHSPYWDVKAVVCSRANVIKDGERQTSVIGSLCVPKTVQFYASQHVLSGDFKTVDALAVDPRPTRISLV